MRVSELSRASGVPVATIKFYLREGLLPRGETTSPNQARYDERHLRRLRLIRALVEVGSLPIAVVKDVLAAVDDPGTDLHRMLGTTLYAVTGVPEDDGAGAGKTDDELDELVTAMGWSVSPRAPAPAGARTVLMRMRELGTMPSRETLHAWGEAADRAAQGDMLAVQRAGDRASVVETALVGTVLGDTLLAALRRMAQESHSAQLLRPEPPAARSGG